MSKYFSSTSKYFNYFNKEHELSVQDKITDLEGTLERSGAKVPPKNKRSVPDRLFNLTNVGNYAVMGGLTGMSEVDKKWKAKGYDFTHVPTDVQSAEMHLKHVDKKYADAYREYRTERQQAGFKGVIEGLKGANPFGEAYTEGRKTADDWFEAMGWEKDNSIPWYVPTVRGTAALVADIVTDPTTYMTFGVGGAVRGTGKTLAGKSIKEGTEATAAQIAKLSAREQAQRKLIKTFDDLGTKGVIEELGKVGVKVGVDDVPDIIARVHRDSKAFLNPTGQSLFGKKADAAIRKFGDNTIAPYVNTGIDALGKSKLGIGAKKITEPIGKRFGGKAYKAAKLAKENPVEYMKIVEGGFSSVNKAFLSYKKMQENFTGGIKDKFSDIPQEVIDDISMLTEMPDAMKAFRESVFSHDTAVLSDEALALTKTYNKHALEIEDILDAHKKTGKNKQAIKVLEAYKDSMDVISGSAFYDYDSLIDLSTDLKNVFEDKTELKNFLNNVKNDSRAQIEIKLKDIGVEDTRRAAYEARTISDKITKLQEVDGVDTRKYFAKQLEMNEPVNMDAGRPYTDGYKFDNSKWYDKWEGFYDNVIKNADKYPNSPIPSTTDIQEHFLSRYSKEMTPDDYVNVQLMLKEVDKLNKYNADIVSDKFNKMGKERFSEYIAKQERGKVRNKQMNVILEQYNETLPQTYNAARRNIERSKWMGKLRGLDDKALESKYNNALKYKASNAGKYINKHEALADDITDRIVTWSRATQGKAKVQSKQDVKALMIGKDYDELLTIKAQLDMEGKGFEYKNIPKEIDSGTYNNMADKIETERFNKNAIEYAGIDEEALIADNYLDDGVDSFTDSARTIKRDNPYFNKVQGKQTPVKRIEDAFNVGDIDGKPTFKKGVFNEYNVDGAMIYAPVNVRTDATVAAVMQGFKNVGVKDKNLARLLSTMKVFLTDIEGASEAIEGSSTVIFGKNINKIADYDKYVAEKILPHEVGHEFGKQINGLLFKKGGASDWTKAIRLDGNELFKGKKVISGNRTDYKLMNEDMAESFRMFLTNPKAFKTSYPNRYATLKSSLENLNVDDARINMALDTKNVVIPPDAYKALQNERLTLEAEKQTILNKTSKMSQAQAEAEMDRVTKLSDNNYYNERFADVYAELHPDKPLYTKKTISETKLISELDVENDIVKTILAKHTPENQKKLIDSVNWMSEQFGDIYRREEASGYMNARQLENYMPHIKRKEGVPGGSKTPSAKVNKFDQNRTVNKSIKEFNDDLAKRYGFDSFKDIDPSKIDEKLYNEIMGESFESNAVDLLLMRGIKSNQLLFTKQFYNNITDKFGTVYKNVENIPAGAKLFASSEDIYNVIKNHASVDEVFNQNLYDNLINNATRNGKAITKELSDELKQQAISKPLNKEAATKLIKDLGLPEKYIDSFSDAKQGIEAFLKLNPMTEIDANMFKQIQNIEPRFSSFSMHELLVDKINKAGMIEKAKSTGSLLKLYDRAHRLWKINATAANPGFIARNAYSNPFQEFLNVGFEVLNPISQLDSTKMALGRISDKTYKFEAGTFTQQRLMEIMEENNVLSGGIVADAIKEQGRETFLQKTDNNINALRTLFESKDKSQGVDLLKSIGRAVNPLDAENNFWYKGGGAANQLVENQARINLFMANLKQGKGIREAADNVNKFLFDYTDLSDFETNVMKRLIPFYTWMRKNIPLQLEQYLNNPRAYSIYNKVANNVNKMTPEKDRLKATEKNQFAQDWMQLPFSTIGKDNKKQPTFFNPNLPLGDLEKLDITQAPKNIFTSLTPFLKVPTEIVMNKNVFFENDISKGIGDTDDAPGYLQGIMGGTKKNPAQMDPYVRYVLKNIGSLENLSKIGMASSQTRKGQPVSDKALAIIKWIAGLSGYSYDVDKYVKWSDRDRLSELRKLARSKGLIE